MCVYSIQIKKRNEYKHTCGNTECIEKLANSDKAKQKCKETCLIKYKTTHQLKSKLIQNKMKQTNLKRRGVEYSYQDPIVKEKIKQTNLKRWGVENPSQCNEIKQKLRKINQPNHETYINNEEINVILIQLRNIFNNENIKFDDIYIYDEYFIEFIKLSSIQKRRMLYTTEICNIFNKANNTIIKRIKNLNLLQYFDIKNSDLELQFKELLESNNFIENNDFVRSDRSILPINQETNGHPELDFLFKTLNIAFEINDIATHNTTKKNKYYDHDKTNNCKKKNIRLIHIWEWELRKDNLYSRLSKWILNLLNISKFKIFARKCEIKLVPINEEKDFLNQYHLQGYKRSEICLGLYYNNELLQIMSFCKSRWNKNYEWELLRLCIKFGYIISFGAQKLLKNFIKGYNPKSIISYCNLDKFDGSIYERIGFKLLKYNPPSITWYNEDSQKIFSQKSLVTLGADKLIGTKLGKGTDNVEIMENISKYKSVYNCGQNIYVIDNL